MGWNFGDILDAVGGAVPPDAPAFIHGERVIPWGEANRTSGMPQVYSEPGTEARAR